MFILRSYDQEVGERNTILGKDYTVLYKDVDHKRFEELKKEYFSAKELKKMNDCFALIEANYVAPLYSGITYYIMTDGGKTFDKIKKREENG